MLHIIDKKPAMKAFTQDAVSLVTRSWVQWERERKMILKKEDVLHLFKADILDRYKINGTWSDLWFYRMLDQVFIDEGYIA